MPRRNTPKSKRKGPSPQHRQAGHRVRGGKLSPWLDDSSRNASSTNLSRGPSGGHTLANEARNTAQRRRGPRGEDARLRYKPVAFLSSGYMNPLKELEIKQKESEQQLEPVLVDVDDSSTIDVSAVIVDTPKSQGIKDIRLTDEDFEPSSPPQTFVIDTVGDKSLLSAVQHIAAAPDIDQVSEHGSESSEDVIVFKGRGATRQNEESQPSTLDRPKAEDAGRGPPETQAETQGDVVHHMAQEIKQSAEVGIVHKAEQPLETSKALDESGPSRDLSKLLDMTQSDEEAAMIADYIGHVHHDSEDGDDNDAVGETEVDESDVHPGLGSQAFYYRDLGGTDSDAVPEKFSDDGDDDDKGDSADTGRRKLEIEDERMARMLAKQEELGLGSNEIVLYNDVDFEESLDDWKIAPKPRRKKKGSFKAAKIIQKKGQYPSATQLAEAFDDLDLMDWHRPALGNFTNKKTKVPHVSDSELEEAMEMAFQKDRLKKAEKKKQREALRVQGLLGKNVNPSDLRIKYPAGLKSDDLVFELEQFLLGTDEQLVLPPLDKDARRLIHLIAKDLRLKSQSSGKGLGRYPVLYRTGRTVSYNEHIFTTITHRYLKRPWFPRVDVDAEILEEFKLKNPSIAHRNSRHKHNAISYKEGDIVGQNASELGHENKGRLLLEKMGWSKGMSLGAKENEGILVPIVHVVKKSKAGLGEI